MKNAQYIKKYDLSNVDKFDHNLFILDFGNEIISRIEVARDQQIWNEDKYWSVIDSLRKKWDMLDLKCKVPLPEEIWTRMRREIVIPLLEENFPKIAKEKDIIDRALIPRLQEFFMNSFVQYEDLIMNNSKRRYLFDYEIKSYVNGSAFEWDENYNEKAIGELNYRPNFYLEEIYNWVYWINKHSLWYAFDKFIYLAQQLAARKAKVQFRIKMKEDQRRKEWNESKFDWYSFIGGLNFGFRKFDLAGYVQYFEVLKIKPKSDITELEIKESFRSLSLKTHPDPGGNREEFEEIVEAKNKCLEYVKLSKN